MCLRPSVCCNGDFPEVPEKMAILCAPLWSRREARRSPPDSDAGSAETNFVEADKEGGLSGTGIAALPRPSLTRSVLCLALYGMYNSVHTER